MRNFLPMEHAIKRLENVKPSMRYDGSEPFDVWQKKAYDKVYELLGLDKFEKCDLDIEIEYDKIVDDKRDIRFTFQSEEGYYTICRMILPKDAKGPMPVCICLQGHSLGMHESFWEKKYPEDCRIPDNDFAIRAVKEGFCAVAIEQRNFGEAGGSYPDACVACYRPSMYEIMLGRTTIGGRVWDVMRCIDALTEKFADIADVENIILMGLSGGGTACVYAACMEKRIKAAMPAGALCTFAKSLGIIWHCSCNYVPGIAEYFDMGDISGLIAPRPLVHVHGDEDRIFLPEGAEETHAITKQLYKAAGAEDKCTLVMGNGGHRFFADHAWEAMHKLLDK